MTQQVTRGAVQYIAYRPVDVDFRLSDPASAVKEAIIIAAFDNTYCLDIGIN